MDNKEVSDNSQTVIAALDMGSNSFHMVIARYEQGEMRTLERIGEKVQLAEGLSEQLMLSEESQQRAFKCLEKLAQRLHGLNPEHVRIVGTNALRMAKNAPAFLQQVQKILHYPVDIIAGREEARLIYLGVAHTLADDAGHRLVIDIGGGSTEFIIGQRFESKALESLHMGCVSFSQQFFKDGVISEHAFAAAVQAAEVEILAIRQHYKQLGWDNSVGASGTVRSILQVIEANGWGHEKITVAALEQCRLALINYQQIDELHIVGLREERKSIFPGGLAILTAIFNSFSIADMQYSDGALREGVLYDMIGRITHEDVRERTINALVERYHIDVTQGQRVQQTALALFNQCKKKWQLDHKAYETLLVWAARIHELGYAISHTQFHKHGSYILQHADLPGFSRQDQQVLAVLVRSHRRKFPEVVFAAFEKESSESYRRLALILRLAVLLNHARNEGSVMAHVVDVNVNKEQLIINFEKDWLAQNPLTQSDLEQEQLFLVHSNYSLIAQ